MHRSNHIFGWQKIIVGGAIALHLVLLVGLSYLYEPMGVGYEWAWVPSLGVGFSIHLDGLSMLFSWLICGMGIFIQLYAYHYMEGKPSASLFHFYLTLFMMAMLGLVLASNVILLFIFWELTTLTSYLLIGFNHEHGDARENALQAVLVTGLGGLALLAGLILLGGMAGSYELGRIIERAPGFLGDGRFPISLVLILLGAFTKSAQVPFHFWLPNAMAAPAPVSAYLHSATMVKAGVYLLARLSPVYGHSELWFWALAITGGTTAVWTGILALKQRDLKLMLAHSTNVALGKLIFLLAFGTPFAILAGMMFLGAHALYKASLFMVIGTVDKATGTRDIERLTGLGRFLKFSFLGAGLAMFSKAGLPPMPGFLSKEYMYKGVLGFSYFPAGVLILVNAIMVALAFMVVLRPFVPGAGAGRTRVTLVEGKVFLWLPPVCLGILGIVFATLGLEWMSRVLLIPASMGVNPNLSYESPKLWQGVNVPLAMGAVSLFFGGLIFGFHKRIRELVDAVTSHLPSGDFCYGAGVKGIMRLAAGQTSILQHGRITGYIFTLFFLLALVVLFHILPLDGLPDFNWQEIRFHEFLLAGVFLAAVSTVLGARTRMLSMVALGSAGFITTLFLIICNAPDVAKTQLLVEALTLIFIVMIVRQMPGLADLAPHSTGRRCLNAGIALTIGGGVFLGLYGVTTLEADTTLVDFFAANGLVAAHGRNIVNVILVDFRALDTLGEIMVVVMAAMGASAILPRKKRRSQ